MAGVVELTVDSEDDIAEVVETVDVTVDDSDEDDLHEVQAGGVGEPPPQFHGYRLGAEIGRGASGKVFVCKKKGSHKGYAVKIVSLKRLRMSRNVEREQKKLKREVDILKKLPPHPNIVQYVDAYEEGDWFLLVLELVGGGDLFTALTSRTSQRLNERESAYVLRQLANGLMFLHEQGVIHRDLKLENVLVASEKRIERGVVLYRVKITDFGLSKAVGAGLSEARSTVGTRPYTAPEVLHDGLHDTKADIWCLGVLLYVLLAGQFPFDHTLASQQSEVDRIVGTLRAKQGAKGVVRGFMQIDPEKRLTLEELTRNEWLCDELMGVDDEVPSDRPRKRTRAGMTIEAGSSNDKETAPPGSDARVSSTGATATGASAETARGALHVDAVGAAPATAVVAAGGPSAVGASVGLAVNMNGTAAQGVFRSEAQAPPDPEDGEEEHEAEADDDAAKPAAPGSQAPAGSRQAVGVTTVGKVAGLFGGYNPAATTGQGFASDPSQLTEICPPSRQPDVMQVHILTPEHAAGVILGKCGKNIQNIAATSGCTAWMTKRRPEQGAGDRRRVIVMGNYKQCAAAQQMIHALLRAELKGDSHDEQEVWLLVRAEAAGVVIGKQGYKINQIRRESRAHIHVFRHEVENQRPCAIKGSLDAVLTAERHIFDLVRAVPVAAANTSERRPAFFPRAFWDKKHG